MSVKSSISDGLGMIQLDGPTPQNLFARSILEEKEEMAAFLSRPELTCAILTVHGAAFFADIELGKETSAVQRELEIFLSVISKARVPVGALLLGRCVGYGLAIALSCHFRFATETSKLGFPPEKNGFAICAFLSQIPGSAVSRQSSISLILSGKMISAAEAQRMGLVDGVWPSRDLEARSIEFMRSLTKNRPPHLVHTIMQSINNSFSYSVSQALHREKDLFDALIRQTIPQDKE
jgi:enoyl-CoA hydratase/carnithine racemase